MVQPAEVRDRDGGAVAVLDIARFRRVAVQRLMAARLVVVLDVLTKHVAEVVFAPRDDVVGALARGRVAADEGVRVCWTIASRPD